MNTAIIGANGFLGSYLLRAFINQGHKVTAIYNQSHNKIPYDCELLSFNKFLDEEHQFDNIIFTAGSFQNSHFELIELNCSALLNITNKFPLARHIYISSSNVYGSNTNVINEKSAFENPSLYGRAKLAGEFIVSASKSFAIVRLVYLYGPKLNNKSFIPIIIEQATTNKKITLMGRGEREQDYLYVEDAARLCVKAAGSELNEVFLGATGKSISNLEVAKFICREVNDCEISFTGEERGQSFYFDPTDTFNKLNWHPEVSFSEGIKKYFSCAI